MGFLYFGVDLGLKRVQNFSNKTDLGSLCPLGDHFCKISALLQVEREQGALYQRFGPEAKRLRPKMLKQGFFIFHNIYQRYKETILCHGLKHLVKPCGLHVFLFEFCLL